MGNYKICQESCFQYDPIRKGCSYNSADFDAVEKVEPGQKCLHPKFSHDQLKEMDIVTFCNLLAGPDVADLASITRHQEL